MKKIYWVLSFFLLSACGVATQTNHQTIKADEASDETSREATSDEHTETKSEETVSKKAFYKQKLDAIELGLSDLDALYNTGVTLDILNAENEALHRWDVALNEIYQALKAELPSEAFEQLRNEQRQWIKTRDQKADITEKEYEGGSAGGMAYVGVLHTTTKERCYELLDYFK